MFFRFIFFINSILLISFYSHAALPPFPFVIESLEKEHGARDEIIVPETPEEPEKKILIKEFIPSDVKAPVAEASSLFPVPQGLEENVEFWVSVYTKYNNWDVILHDADYPSLVYEVVEAKQIMDDSISYRSKLRKINNIINSRKKYYKRLLIEIQNKVDAGETTNLSEEEKNLFEKFTHIEENKKFLRATYKKRMRMQLGQRNNFILGLQQSGKYLRYIEDIFTEMNMPRELIRLIYVESMFNLKAYSKVGASGIWQFMRSTGKRFLEISYAIDERRDPISATRAAANLLNQNYKLLKEWPIAITAYNHGARGMLRAVNRVGSTDLKQIIDNYRSGTFGFASKNFYAQFLAAFEVESNSKNYFGEVARIEEIKFKEFILPDFVTFSAIRDLTGLDKEIISDFNPALKEEVFSGHARIPKGYGLKLPENIFEDFVARYGEIPKDLKHDIQEKAKYYTVQRGDNLWTIGRKFNTSVDRIKRLNGIRNGRQLRAGTVLIMP